jgi:hypothetical protein
LNLGVVAPVLSQVRYNTLLHYTKMSRIHRLSRELCSLESEAIISIDIMLLTTRGPESTNPMIASAEPKLLNKYILRLRTILPAR